MSMIPEHASKPNSNPQHLGTIEKPEPTQREYQAWRNAAYECLLEAGFESEADDFLSCAGKDACFTLPSGQNVLPQNAQGVYVCAEHPEHPRKVVFPTCHLRVCPDCAHRDTGRLMARYYDHITNVSTYSSQKLCLKTIVLTTNIDLKSPDAGVRLNHIMNCVPVLFDNLLPKGWRKRQGVLAACEFGADGHKLHIHVLFYGQFIPKHRLSEEWEKLSGFPVTYIKAVTARRIGDAIAETLKYTTKFWSRNPDGTTKYIEPELVPLLVDVLKGTRRIRTYGIFYHVPFFPEPSSCSVCGCEIKRVAPEDWDVYLATGWTGWEWRQVLDLKPGNKSPPANRLIDTGTSPPNDGNVSEGLNQLLLSEDFKPHRDLKGYQR